MTLKLTKKSKFSQKSETGLQSALHVLLPIQPFDSLFHWRHHWTDAVGEENHQVFKSIFSFIFYYNYQFHKQIRFLIIFSL